MLGHTNLSAKQGAGNQKESQQVGRADMCLPRSPVGGTALSDLPRCGRDWEVCPEDVLLTALLWTQSMGVAQQ